MYLFSNFKYNEYYIFYNKYILVLNKTSKFFSQEKYFIHKFQQIYYIIVLEIKLKLSI